MAPPANLFDLLDADGNGDAAPEAKKPEVKKAPPAPAAKDGARPRRPPGACTHAHSRVGRHAAAARSLRPRAAR